MTWPSPTEQTRNHDAGHLDAETLELLALLSLDSPLSETGSVEDAGAEAAHLAACPQCRTGWQAHVENLRASRDEVQALADEAFGDDVLEQQRASILARLSARRDGGRVLAFPARDRRQARRDRPALRWLSAAAAAGLLVGVVAGQQLNHVRGVNAIAISHLFGPGHEAANRFSSRVAAWRPETAATAQLVPVHAHDELFLAEMETALNYRGVAELRALDDLTPRATPASTRRGAR